MPSKKFDMILKGHSWNFLSCKSDLLCILCHMRRVGQWIYPLNIVVPMINFDLLKTSEVIANKLSEKKSNARQSWYNGKQRMDIHQFSAFADASLLQCNIMLKFDINRGRERGRAQV